ncbi:phenazine biosynthesis protein PhzF [Yersinia pekkanenii]|uniref:Phenazine biosynthesis protein PhzF n=1 Tax=Yersinia pekkanenii TaxID=1288385 RepID=A0A0T9PH50_9GAMM|nr:phenazine biosynthesis protein PhzF [Yersinia pekkanenii]CRY67121.1 phenazine biosynthesis protein PhzF [Yersinia pekkanenii]
MAYNYTLGSNEDPVTGSAHCTLMPYWVARLGKAPLHARQISARGGSYSAP